MERKLHYIEAQIIKENIKIDELDDLPPAPLPKEMVDLEAALDKMESELREVNVNAEVRKLNTMARNKIQQSFSLFANLFLGIE